MRAPWRERLARRLYRAAVRLDEKAVRSEAFWGRRRVGRAAWPR